MKTKSSNFLLSFSRDFEVVGCKHFSVSWVFFPFSRWFEFICCAVWNFSLQFLLLARHYMYIKFMHIWVGDFWIEAKENCAKSGMRNHVVMVEEFSYFSHIQGCLKILFAWFASRRIVFFGDRNFLGLTVAFSSMRKIRIPFAQLRPRLQHVGKFLPISIKQKAAFTSIYAY